MRLGGSCARSRVAAIMLASVALASCGSGATNVTGGGVPGRAIQPLATSAVPGAMMGLHVQPEDVSKALTASARTYIDATSVYSFRRSDALLQATLQISRFQTGTRYRSPRFRQTLVDGIGGTIPILLHVGGQEVWLTNGDQQQIAVWFRDRYLFVLAERLDFPLSRSLLRQALTIAP